MTSLAAAGARRRIAAAVPWLRASSSSLALLPAATAAASSPTKKARVGHGRPNSAAQGRLLAGAAAAASLSPRAGDPLPVPPPPGRSAAPPCSSATRRRTRGCRPASSSSSSAGAASFAARLARSFHSTPSRRQYQELDREAVADLFHQYARNRDGTWCLDAHDVCQLLRGIGEMKQQEEEHQQEEQEEGDGGIGDDGFDGEEGQERRARMGPDEERKIEHLFRVADLDGNGVIDMDEFLENADMFIRDNPARIILVIGGPGSGKGVLSRRLEGECNVVHLSSGSLLRDEVERQTPLGREVQELMAKGELVSSAIMVALMKKKMRDHPGKRVLLDGFPRSLENAHDLVTLCGKPELALHLVCDDTILMERIMKRGENRQDDNFDTALQRIRTYHKFHTHTLEWLREQHVPIVNLDCTGPPESVWYQMTAIGKLMRPAVKLASPSPTDGPDSADREDWSGDPLRSTALF